jgi:hypothetical protein
VANAALYFSLDAARRSSVTPSTLSTAGIRRGCGTVSRRARSGRSSVTVNEEAQGRDHAVDARRLQSALRLVLLEKAQVFRPRRVGRPADKGRECPDVADIVVARVLTETPTRR